MTQVTGVGCPYAPELLKGFSAAREDAVEFCQDFLALWKDADLDIPVLSTAKAESAKLK